MTNIDNPIIRRFFVAVEHYILIEDLRGFSTFCKLYDLPRTNLLRLKKEPHRQFHPEWLTLLVKLGYSAHWLLTGEGEMKPKVPATKKTKRIVEKENA
ncbi:hypothetical protein ACXA18_03235 [Riemerella anatipestifer]|uniref:hypothetical protein n=1 Tax=Riemerella anatipestifer TaxID=34085 RepID=UPI00129EA6EC|nr:hypothetical protein [Riemerella anatipestifer]MRM83408.1 hypothetical protein [Riemerella anatipestifer]NAV16651.1 hypothetical protein [Riemerella anatipestifer]